SGFVVSKTPDHARALADEIVTTGAPIAWRAADRTDDAAGDRSVAACAERFGRRDGLFTVGGGRGRRLDAGPVTRVRRDTGDRPIRAYAARKQPLAGEMMDPDEIAHAAVFFLSDESRAVTGQVLKVDGGWSIASVSPE